MSSSETEPRGAAQAMPRKAAAAETEPRDAPAAEPEPRGAAAPAPFDLDGAWQLHPRVALRPERFGALAYHFGNRRLSFLKSWTLLEVVRSLDGCDSAREACRAAGVSDADMPRYEQALATLASTEMLTPGSAA